MTRSELDQPAGGGIREPDPPGEVGAEKQAADNRARAEAAWSETARDMAISDILLSGENRREVRAEILIVVALALVLLVAGLIWSRNVRNHERLVAQETAAGQRTPYVPELLH